MILFISTIIYSHEGVFLQIILTKNHRSCGGLSAVNRKAKITAIMPGQIEGRLSYYMAPILRHPAFAAGLTQFSEKLGLFLFRFGQFLDKHFTDTELCRFGGGGLFDV